MNSTPFRQKGLEEAGFFKKLCGIPQRSNALIELNNLLATKSPLEISVEQVAEIAERYKVDFHKHFFGDVATIYETYLRFALQDRELSEDETRNLSSLKRLLMLTDSEATSILKRVASEVYKEAVGEVLADGVISEQEKELLAKLEAQLSIPSEISQRIYDEMRKQVYKSRVDSIIADERISPDEQKELDLLAKNLNISVQTDDVTRRLLDKYRLFWLIENQGPPELAVDINLQRGEKCHFTTECSWNEFRKVRVSYGYSGPTMRIKIAKGLYWRAGNIAVRPVSKEELTLIESGTLYLTNKRLVFVGSRKSSSIRLDKVLDFEPYKDGIFIQKDSGKSPFLGFTDRVDVFCVTMG